MSQNSTLLYRNLYQEQRLAPYITLVQVVDYWREAMQLADSLNTADFTQRVSYTENFRFSERYYPPNTESPVHRHRNTYIIITLEGRYLSTFGTRSEEFKRWTVSYHDAGVSHSSRYLDEGAKVLYVELPLEHLKRFSVPLPSHLAIFSLQGGVAEMTARHLYREFTHPDDLSPVVMDGLVLQLFAHLCRYRRDLPQNLPRWLGRADEMIRKRFREQLGLETIAKAVGVHPVHLAREYKRYYNSTIGEQVRRLRIEYTCQQLTHTDQSLASIALAAGFSDQSHFAAGFKQHIGIAPSAFRRTTQNDVCSMPNC